MIKNQIMKPINMKKRLEELKGSKNPTEAFFGETPDGESVYYSISEMNNLIIAGTTGSGKTVFINQLLTSMMMHSHPDELKLAIIDPKVVEFNNYKGLPYMMCNPVTNMNEAMDLMMLLTKELDTRYKKMKKAVVENISDYNEWAEKNSEKKFPYIINVISEFSNLIEAHNGNEIETFIRELCQKGVAVGIHVILATQTPRVVTSKVKENFPSRVCLMVANLMESQIVLDNAGGEKLRPYGDMIIKMNGGKQQRCQSGFISNEDQLDIFKQLKE